MRDFSKRIYLSIFWIVIGLILFTMGSLEMIDAFWSGMGGGLLGVGVVQMIRWTHYRRDPEYKERFDTQAYDERNRFISSKAWAWAGYLSVMIGAAGVIGFKIAGLEQISTFCSAAVGVLVVLYWGCWLILKRKY